MVTATMKIEQRNPRELKHYKLNAKQHPETQIKGIVESIKRFGFIQPVVVDKNDEIIIGHGRTMAAMQAGLEEVPTVKLENLTEQEVKALRLIDNRIAETGWDADLLKIDLENLDIDLKPFAVDFSAMMPEPEKEVVEDDGGQEATNELTMKWGVEPGQVWQLGEHRVMCGDSTKEEDVAKLMHGQIAEMIFTDPPYGVTKFEWDRLFTQQDLNIFLKICTGPICVWNATKIEVIKNILNMEPPPDRLAVWRMTSGITGKGGMFWTWQPIFVWNAGEIKLWDSVEFESDAPTRTGQHPTQKPVKLICKWIEAANKNFIADLFLGSGTTLIAAEQLGRKCYGMEISPDYVAVILQRWADFTGKTPELAEV